MFTESATQSIRRYFHRRDYREQTTPVFQRFPPQTPNIRKVQTRLARFGSQSLFEVYLRSSPEHHLKRFLAEHPQKIFEIGPCFRNGEEGRWHRQEFTIVEWYHPQGTLESVFADCIGLLQHLLGRVVHIESFDYDALFQKYYNFSPFSQSDRIIEKAQKLGLEHKDQNVNIALDYLLTNLIENHLQSVSWGCTPKVIAVWNWPAESALLEATKVINDRLVANRFEIYFGGMELGNACEELRDPAEFERRVERLFGKSYKSVLDTGIQTSIRALPQTCGAAMGVDRLALVQQFIREFHPIYPTYPKAQGIDDYSNAEKHWQTMRLEKAEDWLPSG